MEKTQNIESILEQAFQFGTFGTDAEYRSFKIDKTEDTDLSQDIAGTLTYDENQHETTKTLVIKIINEKHPYAFKHLAFLGEISIRRRIIPYLDKYASISTHFAPFVYGTISSTTEQDDAVIILEQLFGERKLFWNQNELFTAMKFLGKLHSTSYNAKVKDPNVFFPQLRRLHEIFIPDESVSLSDKLQNLYQFQGSLKEFLKSTLSLKPEPKSVICIGITSGNKTLFQNVKSEPLDIKITDLFGARYAPPAFDLMNIMYLCVDRETRSKHWNEAMKIYYESLVDGVSDAHVPSFSEIQQDFKVYSLLAYVTAVTVLERNFEEKRLPLILENIEQDILKNNTEE